MDPIRPLDGVTVIDFTQIGAGPTCTMVLADLGARVIKIEPLTGDIGRTLGPAWINGEAALFHAFNRNKESIAIDLKTPEGVAVAHRLMGQADVVVESMRPGVMDRLGVGEKVAKELNEGVIYCSISAYGQFGPYAGRAGVDGIIQADSGLMSLIGTPGSPPVKVQTPVVDIFTGYVAACGVLAGLIARRVKAAPALDISLFRSAIALQQASLTSFLVDGEEPEKQGSAAPYSAPNEAFPTSDGWIMVAAYIGDRWKRLCECLDLPSLISDDRFDTSRKRVQNREAMAVELSARFRQKSTQEWQQALSAADILCAPVSTYRNLKVHPQVAAADVLVDIETPGVGRVTMPASAIRFEDESRAVYRPSPSLGGHSRQILARAEFADDEIERLIAAGVVASRD